MAEELLVTLNRSDSTGFGFSLLGTAGLPHVIYDIVENSPAADSGKVSFNSFSCAFHTNSSLRG
jgi:PH/SEC7 domain-containing protein